MVRYPVLAFAAVFAAALLGSLTHPALAESSWLGTKAAEDAAAEVPPDAVMSEEFPDATEDQVAAALDANLSIFYHEMGHALIDVMQLPVLGLEEDAADILSALLISQLWDAESSEQKLRAAAGLWAASAAETASSGYLPAQWSVHSPDERRYFTYVCLWYGAAPEERAEVAAELGLPEGRAATCPAEYELADQSWGPYLDELYAAGKGETLVWTGPEDGDSFAQGIKDEVDYLNSVLSLPETVSVTYEDCGVENAWYDPGAKSVTMCAEMAAWALATARP